MSQSVNSEGPDQSAHMCRLIGPSLFFSIVL